MARRESKLQALRQKHAETEATFQPHIDPHSAAISLAAAQPFGSELRGGSSGHGGGGSGLGGGGGSSVGRGDIAERLTAEGAVTAQRLTLTLARTRTRTRTLTLTLTLTLTR